MSRALGRETVGIVHRDDDEDGSFVQVGGVVAVAGCSVQPDTGSESYETGQQSRLTVRVFGPPVLAAARSWDLLEVDGALVGADEPVRMPLVGPPRAWLGRHGGIDHVEITLSHTRG